MRNEIVPYLTSVHVERVHVHSLVGWITVGELLFPIGTTALGKVFHVEMQKLVGVGASIGRINEKPSMVKRILHFQTGRTDLRHRGLDSLKHAPQYISEFRRKCTSGLMWQRSHFH